VISLADELIEAIRRTSERINVASDGSVQAAHQASKDLTGLMEASRHVGRAEAFNEVIVMLNEEITTVKAELIFQRPT